METTEKKENLNAGLIDDLRAAADFFGAHPDLPRVVRTLYFNSFTGSLEELLEHAKRLGWSVQKDSTWLKAEHRGNGFSVSILLNEDKLPLHPDIESLLRPDEVTA